MDITGIDKLVSKLEKLDENVNRQSNKVLKSSTEPFIKNLRKKIRLGKGRMGVHAKDDIHIGRVNNDGFNRTVNVGFSKKTYWYMWFLEKGTFGGERIYPRHNVENAMNETKKEVATIQKQGLQDVIERFS